MRLLILLRRALPIEGGPGCSLSLLTRRSVRRSRCNAAENSSPYRATPYICPFSIALLQGGFSKKHLSWASDVSQRSLFNRLKVD
jgi:hypothetical protein